MNIPNIFKIMLLKILFLSLFNKKYIVKQKYIKDGIKYIKCKKRKLQWYFYESPDQNI
jgi:hypothetical protein